MFSATLPLKSSASCGTIAIAVAQRGERDPLEIDAVEGDASALRRVEARHEVGDRRLARARRADERDRSRPPRCRALRSSARALGPRRTRKSTWSKRIVPSMCAGTIASGPSSRSIGRSRTSKTRAAPTTPFERSLMYVAKRLIGLIVRIDVTPEQQHVPLRHAADDRLARGERDDHEQRDDEDHGRRPASGSGRAA